MTDFEQNPGFEGEENIEKEEIKEEPKTEEPQTYGVSYSPAEHGTYNNTFYGGTYQPPHREEPKNEKKGNGGKIAAIAIIAAACILFSFLAGALGTYVTRNFNTPTETNLPKDAPKTNDEFRPDGKVIVDYVEVDGKSYETDFTEVVAKAEKSVVEIEGRGSGVIYSQDDSHYYIVTNNHVVDGATKFNIVLSDGTQYEGILYATDALADLAIVVIDVPEGTVLTKANIAEIDGEILDGQEVFIIGNPLGLLGGSVAKGIIGKSERVIVLDGVSMSLIQLGLTVNFGNSGGGLFDMAGNLIGIVNAKSTGYSVEGLGYAIPISTVKSVCADLILQKYVSGRVSIGMELNDVTVSDFMLTYSFPAISEDTTVTGVENNSTFAFEKNDLIASVNDEKVSSTLELQNLLNSKYKIGDKVKLVVYRAQKQGYSTQYVPHTVNVTLVEYTK